MKIRDIRHEAYFVFNGFYSYHYVKIALEDQYEIAFVMDRGVFIWVIMFFGFKNVPLTYQRPLT
jgi:hypothetical protein